MINDKVLQNIQSYALKIDWDDAFGGKSKGNNHLERVVLIAKYLSEKEGADINIVQAGAFLHDIALPSGDDYNYENNKKIAVKELSQFNLDPQEADSIAECVASHEGTESPKTIEAQIVHDADVLDKSGILGIIRHTWKLVNLGHISSETFSKNQADKILDHLDWRASQLKTKSAKDLYKKVSNKIDKAQIFNIIQEIIKMVEQGLITEQIAQEISESLDKAQKDSLKSQIELSFIDKIMV